MAFLKGIFINILIAIAFIAISSFILQALNLSNITLSPSDIQDKINSKIPLDAGRGLTITQAKIDLSNDQVNLRLNAVSQKVGRAHELVLETSSELEYHADKGLFYIRPEQINIESIQANEKLSELEESFLIEDTQGEITETMKKIPVYNLMDNFQGYLVKKAIRSAEVKGNSVIIHLSLWRLAVELVTSLLPEHDNPIAT
jgi:hypothetical protein